ncbi:MAG TPA: undecaprenyl-diphosphatase UppP [Gemmatimonadaceae bacterium]
MTDLQALALGLIQGLSEFLPISSSAHLALTPWFFGWESGGLAFDVALHIGTLVAVAWYFRREWLALARSALSIVRQRAVRTTDEWRLVYLVLATIPAAIAGLTVQDLAETTFRSPRLIAINLMIMGVLLWLVDRQARRDRALDTMTMRDAVTIGFIQCLALVPGVSRSGSTITGGRLLGFDRQAAAVFSFLMSFPVTLAAAVLKAPEAFAPGSGTEASTIVIGIAAAAVSSWLAIAVLLRFVAKYSFGVFAAYRLVLGIVILATIAARG